jgi:hypothetical protein
MKKEYVYEFEYLSEALLASRRTNYLVSAVELKEGDTVVIEKKGRGLFLGKIIPKQPFISCEDGLGYSFVQHIDVSAYFDAIEREERRAELRKEMEAKFAELDKEKKYAYYATLDEDFKELYDAYRAI